MGVANALLFLLLACLVSLTPLVAIMTFKLLTIASLVVVCALVLGGIAYAQQPQAQTPTPTVPNFTERGTGVSMTNPYTPDGKPLTTSTNFGQR
jgi:hypothetical protein